jgi:hypothetical protein
MMLLGAAKNKSCSQQTGAVRKPSQDYIVLDVQLKPPTFRRRNAFDHLIYTELSCNNPSVLTIVPALPK